MRTDKKPLTCEEARDLMFDYLDKALAPSQTERLLAHLTACAECRAELDERRAMLDLIGSIGEEPPVCLRENVMRAIADMPQDAAEPAPAAKILTSKKHRFIPWGTIAAACAVVMIFVAGRGGLPAASGAGDLVAPAADRLALEAAAETADDDAIAATYSAKYVYSDDDEVVIYETTAGVAMFSPGPSDGGSKNAAAEKKQAATALDRLMAANPDADAAVLALFASGFEGLAPVTEAETVSIGGFEVTRYLVTENAAETFGGYVNLFEKEKIDYRVNIPEGSEFDAFQFWLLDDGAAK